MTVKVGLIGAHKGTNGYGIGAYVAREALNNSNCNLAAIMGSTLSTVESAVDEINQRPDVRNKFLGKVYTVGEKADFFAKDDLDLIIICSPEATHYEYIQDAIQNGKHVLVEKPLLQLREATHQERKERALGLVSRASSSGLVLSTNCQRAGIVEVLNSKFKCSNKLSSIDIEFIIKAPNGKIESYDCLYDLLIAHPLSILVKYGVKEISNMAVNVFSANEGKDFREIVIGGIYRFEDRSMNFNLTVGQSIKLSSTSLQIDIDKWGPIDIQVVMGESGEFITKYVMNHNSYQQIEYSDDLLKILIGNVVDSINSGTKPLIDNEETYSIYALQEDLKVRLKI